MSWICGICRKSNYTAKAPCACGAPNPNVVR